MENPLALTSAVMSGEIQKTQLRALEPQRVWGDTSPLSDLSVSTSRRNATSSPPRDPNHLLLAERPELSDFWDGRAWIVSAQRLERAALRAGIHPSPSRGEVADLFGTQLPYTFRDTQRVGGATIALDHDALVIDEILGADLISALEMECYEGHESTRLQPLEFLFTIESFRLVTPSDVGIDRTVAGDSLLTRVASIRNEYARAIADKVAQRDLVAALSDHSIEQPRYRDSRAVNPPDSCVEFHNVIFANFPVNEIAKMPRSAKRIWTFEDCRQGFAVVSDGKRQYVYSEHPSVRKLLKSNKVEKSSRSSEPFSARLERFLAELSENAEYRVCLLRRSPQLERERLELARSILAHDSELFVKSSRSSDGILVLRVAGQREDQASIQSDSVEVGELLRQYLFQVDSVCRAKTRRTTSALERVAINEEIRAVHKRSTMEGFLEKALSCMEAPIVEESIPVARLHAPTGPEKVECRLIFQGKDQLELVGHYVKASPNQTAANIACGGHSRRTYDVIYGLHNQYLEGVVSSDQISSRAATSFAHLQEQGTKLAIACAEHYRKLIPRRPLCDFALDICPVWDFERGTLRFFLLEIQFTYGFSGLTATRPPMTGPTAEDLMARRVASFKESHEPELPPSQRLRQIEANFDHLRAQLGLLDDRDDFLPRHSALRLLQRRLMEEM